MCLYYGIYTIRTAISTLKIDYDSLLWDVYSSAVEDGSLTRRQQFHPHDWNLDLHTPDADESIEDEENDRTEGEVLEDGRLDESAGPV